VTGTELRIGVVLEAFLDWSFGEVLSWLRAAAPEITDIEVGAGGYAPHPHCDWWPIGQGVGYGSSFANQVADLLESWPDAPWAPGFAEGVAVQAVCEAIETSAALARWVEVSEVTGPAR